MMQKNYLKLSRAGHMFCIMEDEANYIDREVRLADVASISAGYPFRGSIEDAPGGGVAVVQIRNVDADTGVDWLSVSRTQLTGRRKPDWLGQGDILFSARGNRNVAALVGVVPGQAVCSPHFFLIRVKDVGKLLPAFVAWQINQEPMQRYLAASATGSYITSIRRQVLEDLPLVMPPLEKQKTIIAFSDAAVREKQLLLELIENRNRQMRALAGIALSDLLKGQSNE
jgi:hypothetical protein